MKRLLTLSLMLVALAAVMFLTGLTSSKQNTSSGDLPSWSVTVHYEFGTGLVQDASVYIRQSGNNLFGSPHTTDPNGFTWFGNGGNSFPDGTYEVRAEKFGYGPGTTTVVISGGSPANPVTHVNIGTPE
ncbi:MAG: hypothetical protein K1X85_06485 [Ignavibacteria bacterium]|nr:hypothetical protein [Ignavibacteria bacterium]